ncbi:MAG: IgA Peptidase M64, partial [Tannerella sp.]|nr:IgA Peptidase M64 [Tannerella sp.]
MKGYILLFATLVSLAASAQTEFDAYFINKSLRIDFALSGNSETQSAALIQLREEPVWGGPHKNLTDPFEYGGYLLYAYDKASGKLVYSRGFNTLFEEWRTTEQAQKETQSWTNSIVMPFPRDTVQIVLLGRNRTVDVKDTLMVVDVNPSSIFIDRGKLRDNPVEVLQSYGEPSGKVDLVFVAEGYTAEQKDKFFADARRFTNSLFETPPYPQRREDFNIHAVFVASEDEGTDFSGKGVFVNTAFNSGFYTFGTDRYLTTPDMKSIRDAVWNVPCDAIFVLVNSKVYGGGGMYNFYAIGTADNQQTAKVFVHEFGHSFAGLADEYFSS